MILEPSLFVSEESGLDLGQNYVEGEYHEILVDIPKQFSGIDYFENIDTAGETVFVAT